MAMSSPSLIAKPTARGNLAIVFRVSQRRKYAVVWVIRGVPPEIDQNKIESLARWLSQSVDAGVLMAIKFRLKDASPGVRGTAPFALSVEATALLLEIACKIVGLNGSGDPAEVRRLGGRFIDSLWLALRQKPDLLERLADELNRLSSAIAKSAREDSISPIT